MTAGRGADDCLGRLWTEWASRMLHEMRNDFLIPGTAATVLRRRPDIPLERVMELADILEDSGRRISAWGSAVKACSGGRGTTLDVLIASLAEWYGDAVSVSHSGNLAIAVPTDHFGYALWLVLERQYGSPKVSLDVTITDMTARIAIAPSTHDETREWQDAGPASTSALEYLKQSGYHVEARVKRDQWSITVWSVVVTWDLGASAPR